jgi:hypothetical protein
MQVSAAPLRHDFLTSDSGWSIAPAGAVTLTHKPLTLEGEDKGGAAWYFVAPPDVVQALRGMYQGTLSFRLGTLEVAETLKLARCTLHTEL